MTANHNFIAAQQWQSLRSDPLEPLADVALSLGVSRDTIRRWIRDGKLRAIRVGNRLKIRRSAALALLHDYERDECLHNVSDRLDSLAGLHPVVSEALITISGSVRNTATLLEVLVATKMGALPGLDPAQA